MAKICIISSLFPPFRRGGAEVVAARVVEGLREAGHQVCVITIGRHRECMTDGTVTMYRIVPRNIFSFLDIQKHSFLIRALWHVVDVFNISGMRQVRSILKHEKPDVVMTHNLKGISYLIPRLIRSLGLVHVHALHDVQLSRPSGLIYFGQEKPFVIIDSVYEHVCRWLFGNPHFVIAPSRWLLEYYTNRNFFLHAQKAVLPNPVILQKVQAPPRLHDSILHIVYVGQLEGSKGISLLLEACKQLPTSTWRLTVVGDGSLRKSLQQDYAGQDHIMFTGWVAPDDLPKLYRQADVTVVPSLVYENSPTVIFESLAANVPVVAADIGGISEIIRDGYNGFTFAPGNSKSLAGVLQHFIDHPGVVDGLRKNAFLSVRNLALPHYTKRLLELLGL